MFVVDDHHLFLSGVKVELGTELEIVGDASEVDAAIEMIREREPDVVLVDVHMPGGGGRTVITEVARTHPDIRFLALSVSDAAEDVIDIIRAGARVTALDIDWPHACPVLGDDEPHVKRVDGDVRDRPTMERVLREMAGPGAVMRVNGFRGGRLPPKDQIARIRFRRNMFAADAHEPGFLAVDIVTKPGLEGWRGSSGLGVRDGAFAWAVKVALPGGSFALGAAIAIAARLAMTAVELAYVAAITLAGRRRE